MRLTVINYFCLFLKSLTAYKNDNTVNGYRRLKIIRQLITTCFYTPITPYKERDRKAKCISLTKKKNICKLLYKIQREMKESGNDPTYEYSLPYKMPNCL
jgi:hypothetical protein